MLLELYFFFLLIGFIEIKQKIDQIFIFNIDLCGYQYFFQLSFFNVGGVVFYIKNNLNFNIRFEFIIIVDDFEVLWIQVYNDCYLSLFCGIMYRYLNGDLERFIEYVSFIVDRIN